MKLNISMLTGACLLAQLSYGQITDPAPYCAAQYDDEMAPIPHYISDVTLGSLHNSTGNVQFAAPHYVYYNNIAAPDLARGGTYSLSVSHDTPPSVHFVVVFIDYNHDNSFADPGERVLQQVARTGITNPSTTTITIPAAVVQGVTRMRVMVFEDDSYTAADALPCTADATGYLNWGETEDYNVNIAAPTGITALGNSGGSLFYPNPANGILYADQRMAGAAMSIYTMEGKVLQHGLITGKQIDISRLTPGQYRIRVVSSKGAYTQPLTILKP